MVCNDEVKVFYLPFDCCELHWHSYTYFLPPDLRVYVRLRDASVKLLLALNTTYDRWAGAD